jgi:hypothetical protein
MKTNLFFANRKMLLHQAASGWIILHGGVILFVVIALLLDQVIENQQGVIITTFLLILPALLGTHIYLYRRNYFVQEAHKETPDREPEQPVSRSILNKPMKPYGIVFYGLPAQRIFTKKIYAICVHNGEVPTSLTLRKTYQVLSDDTTTSSDYIRVIDESGEDNLYPTDYFILIELPQGEGQRLFDSS